MISPAILSILILVGGPPEWPDTCDDVMLWRDNLQYEQGKTLVQTWLTKEGQTLETWVGTDGQWTQIVILPSEFTACEWASGYGWQAGS